MRVKVLGAALVVMLMLVGGAGGAAAQTTQRCWTIPVSWCRGLKVESRAHNLRHGPKARPSSAMAGNITLLTEREWIG
jgi:hypothetical protein